LSISLFRKLPFVNFTFYIMFYSVFIHSHRSENRIFHFSVNSLLSISLFRKLPFVNFTFLKTPFCQFHFTENSLLSISLSQTPKQTHKYPRQTLLKTTRFAKKIPPTPKTDPHYLIVELSCSINCLCLVDLKCRCLFA
jgi:hypothetical protein